MQHNIAMYTFPTWLIFSTSKYRMLIKILILMKCVWNTSIMYPESLNSGASLIVKCYYTWEGLKDKLSINGRSSQEIVQNWSEKGYFHLLQITRMFLKIELICSGQKWNRLLTKPWLAWSRKEYIFAVD